MAVILWRDVSLTLFDYLMELMSGYRVLGKRVKMAVRLESAFLFRFIGILGSRQSLLTSYRLSDFDKSATCLILRPRFPTVAARIEYSQTTQSPNGFWSNGFVMDRLQCLGFYGDKAPSIKCLDGAPDNVDYMCLHMFIRVRNRKSP